MLFRRTAIRLICASLLAAACGVVGAETYPSRPITLVVPFAAGSGTDAVARVVADKLGKHLNQPVVIDNRAGANGQIGVEFAAKAAPDGYTLLMTTATTQAANPWLYRKLRYDSLKDFTPIGRTGVLPFVVSIRPTLPIRSMRELLDYAKANPGKLSFASPNSTSMLAAEAIAKLADVEMINVTYKSAPQALTDILAGHTDLYVVDFGVGLASIRSGKLRPLAMTSSRSPLLPDVPPLADTLPGFDLPPWNGIFGPANLPKPIADQLATALHAVLQEKGTQEKFAALGFDVKSTRTPEEFRKYVADQHAYWGRMVEIARVHPQ